MKKTKPKYSAGGVISSLAPLANLIPGYGTAVSAGMGILGSLLPQDQPATYRGANGTNTNQYGYAEGGAIQQLSPTGAMVTGGAGVKDGVSTVVNGTPINVDHGEVISQLPNGNVVFSNRLIDPKTGKTFADIAKPIEKALKKVKLPSVINDNTRDALNALKTNLFKTQEQVAKLQGHRGGPSFGNAWGQDGMAMGGKIKGYAYGDYINPDGNPPPNPEFPPMTVPAQSSLDRYVDPQSMSTTEQAAGIGRNTNPILAPSATVMAGLPSGGLDYQAGIAGNKFAPGIPNFSKQVGLIKGFGGAKAAINLATYPAATNNKFTNGKDYEGNNTVNPDDFYAAVNQLKRGAELGKSGADRIWGDNTNKLWSDPDVQSAYYTLQNRRDNAARTLAGTSSLANINFPALNVGNQPMLNYRNQNKFVPVGKIGSGGGTPPGGGKDDKYYDPNKGDGYTTGDYMQFGAAGAQVLGALLDKPERQKAYLDNTPLTKQVYDPSRAFSENAYATNAAYMNAGNSYSSAGVNAQQQNINANAYRANANIASHYDQMNKQEATRYEDRMSNRNRFNQNQLLQTDIANQQNRAAYTNNLYKALETVSNVGAGLNQKEANLKGLKWLSLVDPTAYASIVNKKKP